MAEGHIADLPRRGVVAVGGADAGKFLGDLVTADIALCAPGRAVFAGLLTPQGKLLVDFIVFRDGGRFLIDLPRTAVADFVRRLTFYRLRAQVEVADVGEAYRVVVAWDGSGPPADMGILAPDPRLAGLGWRVLVAAGAPVSAPAYQAASAGDYDAHRIALGVPEGGVDYAFGETFPHDADMDQLGGIDFAKGCYVGQEVVSRMEHRGRARRRVVMATPAGGGPLPAAGTPLTAGGGPAIGALGSSANGIALALVRLDRAREAIDAGQSIVADEVPVSLALPPWARFGWPDAASGGPA
jgi:hypothetical protein